MGSRPSRTTRSRTRSPRTRSRPSPTSAARMGSGSMPTRLPRRTSSNTRRRNSRRSAPQSSPRCTRVLVVPPAVCQAVCQVDSPVELLVVTSPLAPLLADPPTLLIRKGQRATFPVLDRAKIIENRKKLLSSSHKLVVFHPLSSKYGCCGGCALGKSPPVWPLCNGTCNFALLSSHSIIF